MRDESCASTHPRALPMQAEAQEYIASCDCPAYLAHADARLAEEAERVKSYLDATTEPRVIKARAQCTAAQRRARRSGQCSLRRSAACRGHIIRAPSWHQPQPGSGRKGAAAGGGSAMMVC